MEKKIDYTNSMDIVDNCRDSLRTIWNVMEFDRNNDSSVDTKLKNAEFLSRYLHQVSLILDKESRDIKKKYDKLKKEIDKGE